MRAGPMRVLVVPDKFKGTLTARQAAEAIAEGWREYRPQDELDLLPMSDGGDGFGEIIGSLLQARREIIPALNAAHEPIAAEWWWSESRQTAVVESAMVIGLAMLPPGKFHPFELDTQGLGVLLKQIAAAHPGARLLIGIGGSATNDAGFGMARGLGYRFEDGSGYCQDRWIELERSFKVRRSEEVTTFSEVTIACDVQNPLLGSQGASRIYGPQKGLRPEDLSVADRSFERLVAIVRQDLALACEEEPGTGAAGGLGYGLRVFLNGRFKPGFEIFSEAAQLREKVAAADLVITGEGSIDRQTLMGKGTGAIGKMARESEKRCIGLAGTVTDRSEQNLFDPLLGIAPELTDADEAKLNAVLWLRRLAQSAANLI